MNFDPEKLISLYFLDHAAMTESEAEQLSEWLKADVEHVRVFIRAALLHHEIHHRGQMTVLMRQAGLKLPGVYGPSADGA